MSASTNTLTVGTRFTKTHSRPWRDADGVRHYHAYTLECRVTALSESEFSWELLAVLDETDRPEAGAFVPEHGKMAWFGWEAALERGDVAVIVEEPQMTVEQARKVIREMTRANFDSALADRACAVLSDFDPVFSEVTR